MYSKEELTDIFRRILKFEQEAESIYDDCINKVDDGISINIYKQSAMKKEAILNWQKSFLK